MKVNDVYEGTNGGYALQGMHRTLWANDDIDLVVTIAIPPLADGARAHYFRAPKYRSATALRTAIRSGDLRPTTLTLPGLFLMSDAQIAERYPPRRGRLSAPLQTRDRYFKALAPVIDSLQSDRRAFFENHLMVRSIWEAVDTSKYNPNQIYGAVHRYLALGIGKNGLLPFRYACGGRGKERRQTRRLGNTTLAFKRGLTAAKGYVLTAEDKEHLGWCWAVFMDGKRSVEDAYALAMGIYWSRGTKRVHGQEQPLLLPEEQRPTLPQFRRWGPRGLDNKAAWETLLSPTEWESNYRARTGTVLDGVNAIGQIAQCDATSCDQQLVTGASRLKPIGSAVRLVIHDTLSSMACGFHVGLEAPSEQVALLAVLSGATSKVELCRRYGVEIEEDDMPPVFFAKYLVDNGEFRTKHVIDVLTGLDSGMELTRVHRGDLKGLSESAHRSLHKLTSHKLSGTTRGRQRKRGEDAPALEACWRFHEYMRLFLMAVKYYNCQQRVEKFFNNHPFSSAMKRDGVPPVRKAIYQWCVRQGLVASPPSHLDALRAALLPEMKAVVRETGVHLVRPDHGDRNDLVQGHRYLGPRATQLKWLERARRSGHFMINVRANPNHLDRIWYIDELGLHELINVGNDAVFVQTATLVDSLTMQDQDVENRALSRQNAQQAHADLVIARSVADDAYRREKEAEIKARKKKPTKKALTANVRENRADEAARLTGPAERAQAPPTPADKAPSSPNPSQTPGNEGDWLDDILDGHRDGG